MITVANFRDFRKRTNQQFYARPDPLTWITRDVVPGGKVEYVIYVYIGHQVVRHRLPANPLHNPYRCIKGKDRAIVVEAYQHFLEEMIARPLLTPVSAASLVELEKLVYLAKTYDELVLLCWCAPKSCHGDVLKAEIERRMKG